jgi:SAM-dependent methyltransferase
MMYFCENPKTIENPIVTKGIPEMTHRDGTTIKNEWNAMAQKNPYYFSVAHKEFLDLDSINIDSYWASGKLNVENNLKKAQLHRTKSLDMLEIGCGCGRMTHTFAKLFRHVYAIDVSDVYIKMAKGYWGGLKNVDFIIGDGTNVNIPKLVPPGSGKIRHDLKHTDRAISPVRPYAAGWHCILRATPL